MQKRNLKKKNSWTREGIVQDLPHAFTRRKPKY